MLQIYSSDQFDKNFVFIQDIITDLNAESEILPLEPVNEDWKGHKVSKEAFYHKMSTVAIDTRWCSEAFCHKLGTEALAAR
jgi:hypothetical protein